ncbi:MAG: diaminopimelate epimerase [Hyphomicrobiales bacterium]|nr:diaminopimelate epimerase [Hyphomicrobiales bacterium]
METLSFTKMHGLGNDFVIVDARARACAIDRGRAKAIANRRTGVGCDQLIVLEPAQHQPAHAFMRIFNADGGEVAACGNAARCVAALLMAETADTHAVIETSAGLLQATQGETGLVSVDMGPVLTDWHDIPLSSAADTLHVDVTAGMLGDAVAVSVGNPHAVFFVDDALSVPLDTLGPEIEHHGLFPERTNVEVAHVLGPDTLRVRVWERGAGITRACGTGACATAVAAARRGITGRHVEVVMDGGGLTVDWREDNHVVLGGPVARSFSGVLDTSLFHNGLGHD